MLQIPLLVLVLGTLPMGWNRTLERAAPLEDHLAQRAVLAAEDVPWQALDPHTRRKVVFTDRMTFVVLEATRSGKPHDLTHWHHHDQITHVLAGDVEVVAGRELRRLGPGSFYRCDRNVPHSLRVLSERAKLVESFAPARDDFRGRPVDASPLGANEVKALVHAWFALFDRMAPVQDFAPHLAREGLRIDFPEITLRSLEDFRRWYAGIQSSIRTASHDIRTLDVRVAGRSALVTLVVRWQATGTDGTPRDLLVRQTWTVVRCPRSGRPVLGTNRVEPLPSSR